jgi:hypothetical protein
VLLPLQSVDVSFLRADPPPGQLPSLAAAHPEAYTALIDCCLRMPVLRPPSLLVPGRLLLHVIALPAMQASQAMLDNTAAVAGLASAVTSLAKRAVQHIRAAADLQSQLAAAATGEDATAAYFPAAAPCVLADTVTRPAGMLAGWCASLKTGAAGTSNAVSSSSSQGAASVALLAVVFVRSLVQLADAMEAAGPEVFLKSLLGRPAFRMRWLSEPVQLSEPGTAGTVFSVETFSPCGREHQHNAEVQWQAWQLRVLKAMQQLWAAFKSVGIAPSAAGEPAAAAAASTSTAAAAAASDSLAGGACADTDPQESGTSSIIGSTSNSNGSGTDQQVEWGYLLSLQQCSPQWAAAVATYEANQPDWEEVEKGALPSTAAAAEQHSQRYAEAIGLCRALAAAAPLPVVCNNPGCGNTAGVSEAAAASKACGGCRCRYCSVACQRSDWKRHKHACRAMAAAEQACV